jgi:hypothetical protein
MLCDVMLYTAMARLSPHECLCWMMHLNMLKVFDKMNLYLYLVVQLVCHGGKNLICGVYSVG